MKKNFLISFICFMGCGLAFAVTPAHSGDVIKIGVLYPQTGPLAMTAVAISIYCSSST